MSKPRPRSQPLLYMLGFALGGPLVGYLLLGLTHGFKGLVGILILSLFVFPVLGAYVVGAVPAALTGLVAGWSLRWELPWLFLLVASVTGAVSTVAWSTMVGRHASTLDDYGIGALLGGSSGLVCALAALRFSGLDLRAPRFVREWSAGYVLLAVLVVVMAVMIATLLLPVATGR